MTQPIEPQIQTHVRGEGQGAEKQVIERDISEGVRDYFDVQAEARAQAKKTQSAIVADVHQVEALRTIGGNTVEIGVQQIKDIAAQVDVDTAAFEAKAKRLSQPYVLSPQLAKEHTVARFLKKPHLLEGEPGTGKTSLAYAVAGEEGLPIIHCRGKSTLTAQSVMYEVDYVGRLNDAMLAQNIPDVLRGQTQQWVKYLESGGDPNAGEFQSFMVGFEHSAKLLNLEKVSDVRRYIKYGELGDAIMRGAKGEKVVLLFDEIDKAKREFPNDLLDELEHLTIRIRETGEEISAPRENVIVVITSNHERDLPEPFLRRCVYSYIDFPDREQMTQIVQAHVPQVNEKLLQSAVERFYDVRSVKGLQKQPSTSEMLDWIRTLQEFGIEEVTDEIPFPETLLKYKEDRDKFVKQVPAYNSRERKGSQKTTLPESVSAALSGERVFRIHTSGNGNPDPQVLVKLANAGFPFTTAKTDPENSRPFMLHGNGIRAVDNLTFAAQELQRDGDLASISNGEKIRKLLQDSGAIAAELLVTDQPKEFVAIEDSTEQYIKGTDAEGRTVYRMADGTFVYEENNF